MLLISLYLIKKLDLSAYVRTAVVAAAQLKDCKLLGSKKRQRIF